MNRIMCYSEGNSSVAEPEEAAAAAAAATTSEGIEDEMKRIILA